MKITFLIGSIGGGGAERVVCNLANELNNRGHEVAILTMAECKKSFMLSDNIQNPVLLRDEERSNFILNTKKRLCNFLNYIKHNERDCYLAFLPTMIVMSLVFKKEIHCPVIAAERACPNSYSIIVRFLLKYTASKADAYVFQTKVARKCYGKSVKQKNAYIIPNSIPNEFLSTKDFSDTMQEKVIVSVGRLTKSKNFPLLIKAFYEVHKKYSDYTLVIYGEGSERDDLQHLIDILSLNDSITLFGQIDNVIENIRNAKLFVLSSNSEGMPNALIEAMALGLPCIATDYDGGSARELIKDGKNGLLVPKGDEEALKKAIINIIDDPICAENYGKEAIKIREILHPQKIFDKWENCILKTIDHYY